MFHEGGNVFDMSEKRKDATNTVLVGAGKQLQISWVEGIAEVLRGGREGGGRGERV